MSLSVLNNISSIYAQNNLAQTQANLQRTLGQLSSGSRINSGADDAAGLSLADALKASATALTQSAKNASEGVDYLQVADGALSQVTSLLNRAVTLATEASNGTLNSSQTSAANAEYQKILAEITTIGSNTEYNGIASFGTGSSLFALTDTGSTITGTIAPADTLSGSLTITATKPGVAGTSTAVALTDHGTTTTGTIDPTATMSGTITLTATTPSHAGAPQAITFSSANGVMSSNSAIIAGDTLSGSINYSESDTLTPVTGSINLANYQGLASSNGVTASLAASQLGTDLNTALHGTTGMTYNASMSGGILWIGQTSYNYVQFAGVNNTETSTVPLIADTAVSGTIGMFSNSSEYATLDMSDYADLTSSNGTLQNAALAQLGSDLTSRMADGSIYTASITGGGNLKMQSNSTGKTLDIIADTFTQGDPFYVTGESTSQSGVIAASSTPTVVDLTGLTKTTLASGLLAQLGGAGSNYTVAYNQVSGALTLGISATGSGNGINAISSAVGTAQTTVGGVAAVNTPTTVSLTGVTTANLQSTLQAALNPNYTVSYSTTTGALSIGLSGTGTTAGYSSIATTSNSAEETPVGAVSVNVFTSDGATSGTQSYNVGPGTLSSASVGTTTAGAGQDLSATGLNTTSSAQAALSKINTAIMDIARQRGTIGANINTLNAVQNVMVTQSTNTLSAENDVTATDYGQATSDMSKFQILSQTGIAALSQANQAQQLITKLLQ